MIFAAGLGTRLRPLTNSVPKALVPLHKRPLLEHTIDYIRNYGYDDIIVNVHHFADKVRQFLETEDLGAKITISDESGLLLDTGGGLKKASRFFDDEPFLLINTDILTNINLEEFRQFHCQSGAAITLATRKKYRSRYLLFDESNILCGKGDDAKDTQWLNRIPVGEMQKKRFSGVHMINPEVFKTFPEKDGFPIMEWYMQLVKTHHIAGYDHSDDFWMDLGRPENLLVAEGLYHRFF